MSSFKPQEPLETPNSAKPDINVQQIADRACVACRGVEYRSAGHKFEHALWQCLRCRSIFADASKASASVADLYDHYYDGAHFQMPLTVAQSLGNLVLSFEEARCTGRFLDIGYGEGGLLSIAREHKWNCYGLEVSPHALEYGHRQGWTVSSNGEADERFPLEGFDVVTMIELLEHVSDPDHFLKSACRWLRPGGILYITTPNANSFNSRFLGLEWSVFSPPEHITIWTAKGLSFALKRAGLEVKKVRTEGFNPVEIFARMRTRKSEPVEVNRNQAGLALNNALSGSGFRRSLKTGINNCLSLFRTGDSLKVRAVRVQ
jgi:2-polyprenyl-3-methyl-5-hydroxy-6-metoxy-1,4-benzoquinol methylase